MFRYQTDIEQLLPSETLIFNPYYKIADVYETCDGTETSFTPSSLVNISRGHGVGVVVSEMLSDTEVNNMI